ncbi:hypothetical protein Y032_0114g436 [Ancylostoma ceylanicum]|nr:hypothetical protein Y032_0114g436 [Ancylostoma ceylanicum]
MFIEFAPQLNSSVMQRIKNGQEDPPPFDVGGNPIWYALATRKAQLVIRVLPLTTECRCHRGMVHFHQHKTQRICRNCLQQCEGGYSADNDGSFDSNVCDNWRKVNYGGLVPTVYMTPHPRSAKNGSQQFNELYNGLVNICHITIRRVWIEVPTSSNWPADSSKNVAFLNDIVTAAKKQSISFQIGIFTNQFDWDHITFGAKELSKGLKLWYWKSPAGSRTPPNFDDFRPFSSWTAPDAKQFATKVSECGIIVNRNVYKA